MVVEAVAINHILQNDRTVVTKTEVPTGDGAGGLVGVTGTLFTGIRFKDDFFFHSIRN